MKKLFILTVLLSCFVLQKADAYPVYSDELPQSYINSVKTNKSLGNKHHYLFMTRKICLKLMSIHQIV